MDILSLKHVYFFFLILVEAIFLVSWLADSNINYLVSNLSFLEINFKTFKTFNQLVLYDQNSIKKYL